MKYRMTVRDKELFRDYLCEDTEQLSFVSFGDDDKDAICDLLLKQFLKENPEYSETDGILKWYYSSALGDDGVVYIIDFAKKRFSEYGIMSEKDFRKAVLNHIAEIKRFEEKSQYIKSKFSGNATVRRRSLIPGYKKFSFFDVENGIEIPFRFKQAKGEEKRPLLVYLHGAGCIGCDNVRPLFEFRTVGIDLKEDCFVLIPQCDNFKADNTATINVFSRSVRNIIGKLSETYTRPE